MATVARTAPIYQNIKKAMKTEFKWDELKELLDQLDYTTWLSGNMNMKYLNVVIDTRRNMLCKVYDRHKKLVSEQDLLDAIEKMETWYEEH